MIMGLKSFTSKEVLKAKCAQQGWDEAQDIHKCSRTFLYCGQKGSTQGTTRGGTYEPWYRTNKRRIQTEHWQNLWCWDVESTVEEIGGSKLPFLFCCEVHIADQCSGILLTVILVVVTVLALSCHSSFLALTFFWTSLPGHRRSHL